MLKTLEKENIRCPRVFFEEMNAMKIMPRIETEIQNIPLNSDI